MNFFLTTILTFSLGLSALADVSAEKQQDFNSAVQNMIKESVQNIHADQQDSLLAATRKKRRKKKKKKKYKRTSSSRRKKTKKEKINRSGFYAEFNVANTSHGAASDSEIASDVEAAILAATSATAVTVDSVSIDDSSFGFSLGGGYLLNQFIAVEAFYTVLGEEVIETNITTTPSTVLTKVTTTLQFSTLDINGKFMYWLNKSFNLMGKFGLSYWMIDAEEILSGGTEEASTTASESGITFNFGLGGEYFITQNLYLNFFYIAYPNVGNDSIGSQTHSRMGAGLGMYF
ncbi:MAG: outer membrane beta-barrel protein [Halobacteriovoraceae bacterium]|nr:outer membrane beta-barrel protein [Halobacteriovoraceae bacterium]MCB9095766.1 outer membrane beta-barrel protein [Halobacteriovoraceae bacterium]